MNKKVLCLIPTLNAQDEIKVLIDKLKIQKNIDLKILVIDSSSSDNTIEILNNLDIEYISIDKKDFNHANTRNVVLDYEVDYYLFMTQDAIPYDDLLVYNLLECFTKKDVVVSYARQIVKSDADIIEQYARNTNYPSKSIIKSKNDLSKIGIKTFFCSDSCAMYDSNYFKKVNGFKKDLNTNEDMEFAARVILDGKKIFYNADAKIYHSHNFSFLEYWRRYKQIGKFFKNNNWIINEVNKHINLNNTGITQAINELKYIYQFDKKFMLKSIIISIIKFIAFKFGNKF